MTFSLAAVFIPVLFMGGILGRLFHEFAVTIGVAVLISGFVSLTLTPMLCQPLPQAPGGGPPRPDLRRSPSGLSTACSAFYERGPAAGRCATAAPCMVFSAVDPGR